MLVAHGKSGLTFPRGGTPLRAPTVEIPCFHTCASRDPDGSQQQARATLAQASMKAPRSPGSLTDLVCLSWAVSATNDRSGGRRQQTNTEPATRKPPGLAPDTTTPVTCFATRASRLVSGTAHRQAKVTCGRPFAIGRFTRHLGSFFPAYLCTRLIIGVCDRPHDAESTPHLRSGDANCRFVDP